jgi:hypothetical protein
MTDEELKAHVKEWTGTDLNWSKEDMVWLATQDGGELVTYFEVFVIKMKRARERYLRDRATDEGWVTVA